MAYSWDNRVRFIIDHLYDIDRNGHLDKTDFLCSALRSCVAESRGECSASRLREYQYIMLNLWEEISQLADFNQDGVITVDEFKRAVQESCVGRTYQEFPQAMKAFIETNFRTVDVNSDGVIDLCEFRYDCVLRQPVDCIDEVDQAYYALLTDDDRRRGGLTLSRYQELYANYLGNPEDQNQNPAVYLFGPLRLIAAAPVAKK